MTDAARSARRALLLAAALVGLAAVALGSAASAHAAGSWWHLDSTVAPTILPLAGEGQINAFATDLGYQEIVANSEHPVTLTDTVPEGLEIVTTGIRGYISANEGRTPGGVVPCTQTGQVVTCTLTKSLAPSEGIEVVIPVKTPASAPAESKNTVSVAGGASGTPGSSLTAEVRYGSSTPFGVERFELTPENAEGGVEAQAGSHPFQLTTTLNINQTRELQSRGEEENAVASPRNFRFTLPPGLLGNVTVVPQCSDVEFTAIGSGNVTQCKPETAVGVARIKLNEPNVFKGVTEISVPVFNLVPAAGEPARFGIEADSVVVVLDTRVRTGSDYAVEVEAQDQTEQAQVLDSQVTFWGVPGDPRHNASRGWNCLDNGYFNSASEGKRKCEPFEEPEPKPFLSLPTQCSSAPVAGVVAESWPQGNAREVSSAGAEYHLPTLTGCNLLGFEPELAEIKTSTSANSPTELGVKINVPQQSTLAREGLAEADVSETKLELPEGIQANPAAANGLLACSGGEFGFNGGSESVEELTANDHFNPGSISCPEASKIGTVNIKTPLLAHELTGGAYLASQNTNPFGSPLVLYLFAEDPVSGVRVKLAGEVQIDQSTGRLTSIFKGTPPVPFETLTVSLFGGGRASQSTPSHCGTYSVNASMTPSSGAPSASLSKSFSISSGAEGGSCPSNPLPFSPEFKSGSANSQAGAFTNFILKITHPDSNQPLTGIEVHLPPGVAAMLSGVTPCAEPSSGQEWSCGSESLVGHAKTSAGFGSEPVTLEGQVYLTVGYNSAPFGLLVATHAKAGPFDLGMVNVRSRINVDQNTAAVTVTTDAGPHGDSLPTMLKGVPVDLKKVEVTVDRSNFQFNPTNCSAMAVTGKLSGNNGGSSSVSSHFQVEHCQALPFKPVLTASTQSTFSKDDGAAFNVTVTSAPGQANIAKTRLVIPESLPSRLSTIQKSCKDSIFAVNPAGCAEGSVIGMAIVHTPVLKGPLVGPAYLVSHGSAAFPDVEFVLQGEGIKLILDGQTFIHNGVTTSTFNSVPDAPVSSFEAILPRGPHSALTAYLPGHANLCGSHLVVPTTITGQNGVVIQQNTPLAVTGCAGVKSFKASRSQLLARALRACRRKKGTARARCERQARKKYGTPARKAKKKQVKK